METIFRKVSVDENNIPEDGEYDTNLGMTEVFCGKWVADNFPEWYLEEIELPIDEIWDKYSERIDTDIDSLQFFAGKDVMTKDKYNKGIRDLFQ